MKLTPFTKPLDPSKKDEILDAALQVFAEVGFKEATVRQICKRAKANVCLVSYYFEGKEGLYKSVFERVYNEKITRFQDLLQNASEIQNAEEYKTRLRVHIEQMHLQITQNFNFFRVIQREVMEGLPRLENMVIDFMSITQHNLAEYIAFGQKKKIIKKELNPQLATSALMLLLVGFLQHRFLNRPELFFRGLSEKEIPENINKIITTIFFDGVIQ